MLRQLPQGGGQNGEHDGTIDGLPLPGGICKEKLSSYPNTERFRGQRVISDSGKQTSPFHYEHQAAVLVVRGCSALGGIWLLKPLLRVKSVTFAGRRLQNQSMFPLEEVQLPGHVAGSQRVVSCYHHYLRGKHKRSASVLGALQRVLPSRDAGDVSYEV